MNSLRLAPVALVLAGLAGSPAAQGGGQTGQTGGVGGTYSGPGDTVPPGGGDNGSPPTPPPPHGGPADTGPGGHPGAGPATGPPTAGPVGHPLGPGGLTPMPPDEPTTPDAQPPVADPTSWQLWWHYNRWDHLPVGRGAELLAASGAGDLFLGRGQVSQQPDALRASQDDVRGYVQPVLLEVLRKEARSELIVYALQALAKLGDYPVEGAWNFDAAARHHLADGSQEVAEGALLAVGIRGDRNWTAPLLAVLKDTREGRELVGRSRVGHRLRTFAAYGLALLANQDPDPVFRLTLYRQLVPSLQDERPEVQAALLAAIGATALPAQEGLGGGTAATGPVTLADQILALGTFLGDQGQSDLARSQAPKALAELVREAPDDLRGMAMDILRAHSGPRARSTTEVRNGAVLALGRVGRSTDAVVLDHLERVVVGPGADRLTRYFGLVSMAAVASRAGVGDDPFAGLEPTRRFLLRQMKGNRGMQLAWTALALGILEEGAFDRGGMPTAESAAALRVVLESSRNGDVAGAAALALGMLRDVESKDALVAMAHDSGSGVLRGYASLAVGMIGSKDGLVPLREQLMKSTGFPGSLQRIAIGLSLLGDAQAGPVLANMLIRGASPEVQASIAAALGWIKDPRPLARLSERLQEDRDDLARAWTAVAVGRIADPAAMPWNAGLMVGVNYDVPLVTLRDPDTRHGVLDYP